ncbi:MAG: primosomal protein N' [Candidatus Izimaplasma sp.]|nr:primosomal protein N' [Candidatus Izimaplasma bacterium]
MKYYQIALPINVTKLYVYKNVEKIESGCRVLVSFNNTFHTGIVWQEIQEIDKSIKYKDILDIVDREPKISSELLELALWISKYYHCSLGQSLSAMLPSAFNIQLQRKVRLVDKPNLDIESEFAQEIVKELNRDWFDITKLKEKLGIKASEFNTSLEDLENSAIVEIQREFDEKIKPKIANFVTLQQVDSLPHLTVKQTEAYEYMKNISSDFPLAKIAAKYSYSVVKALRNKGLLLIEPREVRKQYFTFPQKRILKDIKLTAEQQTAISVINKYIHSGKFHPFLLFGITGSGKTEVYIETIKQVREMGKSALMLVPEIALTPQMEERFFSAFEEDIAILHSHLNERERWQAWKKIKSGKSKIVIGARSAIFAPLENIGIIIVDEEHESSYKQDSKPRYNGRDVAIVRAKKANALVILGSATPSLESWNNVLKNRYTLLKLQNRPNDYKIPSAKIIDMRLEEDNKDVLSAELARKIKEKLEAKEQIILLQNRRGHSSFVQCVTCGKIFDCPNCDISMKFHSSAHELICHYCGHKIQMPRKCPDCGSYLFNFGSPGTQQIEKILEARFPTARILRMDSDTASKKDSYDSMFQSMRNGYIDILLGTQMIAKGLDFPNVTLVGVISADTGLNFPDFRAAEKTFQIITQVAGRCGRGEKPGEVFIQTYNPGHYAIISGMHQDFDTFAEKELNLREQLNYSPSYRIGRILFTTEKKEQFLIEQLRNNKEIINNLRRLFPPAKLYILGPTAAPLSKLQNKYRYHIVLKAASAPILSKSINFLKENLKFSSNIMQQIDIDPYNLL